MPRLHRQVFLFVLVGAVCNGLHASPLSAKATQQVSSQKGSATTPPPSTQPTGQQKSADEQPNLGDDVIQDVLEPIRTGMETQNIRQVLSAFDKREAAGYSDLEQQLRAFFRQFDEVRFRYQLMQAELEDTPDKDRATVAAEMDMDAMPYSVTQIAVRRSVQMHFHLKRDAKGWKVLSFSPANFFDVDYSSK